jgi:hypothetical protein
MERKVKEKTKDIVKDIIQQKTVVFVSHQKKCRKELNLLSAKSYA